eukprot:GFUD01034882.1.p1 GENE.GFUD01034882.1~~GFUD01034882.1.p1  ORF type:complete len:436 (-),score=99.92 GFUD01034882.1:116-1423(-)
MNKYVKFGIFAFINIIMLYFIFTNISNYTYEFAVTEAEGSVSDVDNKDSDLNSTHIIVESIESNIENMKNVLLYKIKPKLIPGDSNNSIEATTIDRALAEALTDSSEIDLSPPNPIISQETKPISNLVEFQKVILARNHLLKRQCSNKKSRQSLKYKVFYPLPRKSLVWCPVFKAASTNWMHNILHLAGKTEKDIEKIIQDHPQQPNEQARVVAPLLPLSKLREISSSEQFKGMLVVRHPFDRLVSAYRDKLERCHAYNNCASDSDWYYKTYGKKIVKKYRKGAELRFGPDYFSKENNFGSPIPLLSSWRSRSLPSWWEFVQYILHTSPSSYDEHWKPASLYCSVCSFPYNYILHFENIQQEEKFFAQEMSASDLIHPRWENRNDEGLAKEEILGKYFNMLDDKDITALYKIYEDDFKMFGYKFEYKHLRLNLKS